MDKLMTNTAVFHVPVFPYFKKLELRDRSWMDQYIVKYPPYSDFNFVSLWSYNINDQAEVSTLNNNLVIKLNDYINAEPFYTFIGEEKIVQTIDKLLKKSLKDKMAPYLKLVPEVIINKLRSIKHGYTILEDLNNHDYIYSLYEHAHLYGQKYKDQRNLINRFIKNTKNYSIRLINIQDIKEKKQILNLFIQWEKIRNKSRNETEHELKALSRLLIYSDNFKLASVGVYYKNILIAFAIKEIVHDKYVISHFLKADQSFSGVTEILRSKAANYLIEKECEFLNFEQDLGIEGLRRSKFFWHPTHLLKKYIITYATIK